MENKDIQFHITVKGIVIYEGKTLILKRVRPSSDGLGYWELPGGGLEYGEDPHQALVRELKEETGLDIEIIKPVYTFTAIRPHYQTVGIGFLCIPTNREFDSCLQFFTNQISQNVDYINAFEFFYCQIRENKCTNMG